MSSSASAVSRYTAPTAAHTAAFLAAFSAQQYAGSWLGWFAFAGRFTRQQPLCVHNATAIDLSAGKYTTKDYMQTAWTSAQAVVFEQIINTPPMHWVSLAQNALKKAY